MGTKCYLGLEGVEDIPTWVWSDAILGLESGEEDPLGQEGVPILGMMKETVWGLRSPESGR